jgi:hypothetical protein
MEVADLANVPGVRGKLAKCDQQVGFWAQILIAVIIADVQRDDYGWVALVEDQGRIKVYRSRLPSPWG